MRYWLITSAMVTLMAGTASAQVRTVDQSNPYTAPTTGLPTSISIPVDRNLFFGQSFTPALNSISFATFYLENQFGSTVMAGGGTPDVNGPSVPALFSVSLYQGFEAYNVSTLLATSAPTLIPATSGLANPFYNAEFDFASSIGLAAGQQYTLLLNDLTHAATPTLYDDVSVLLGSNTYAGGKLTIASDGSDLFFSEGNFGSASAVPEPATWAMTILGMGAIGFAMRRQKLTTRVSCAA